ncbi:hypothetical protein VTJ49DRAFT_6597 [Mycothermus thermophilus]|uniref:AAA+ ATPase domain-containing protein n=1 Tax=Humicola insolens TaxID=85995 RepID=A0ABR3VIY6_HUMIN
MSPSSLDDGLEPHKETQDEPKDITVDTKIEDSEPEAPPRSRRRARSRARSRTRSRSHAGRDSSQETAGLMQEPPEVNIIPEARRCTFAQFVNRFSLDESGYAIEYLEAGAGLGSEMVREVTLRRLAKLKDFKDQNATYKSRRFDGGLSSGNWLLAVRIQSPIVLKTLSEVSGYDWGTEPLAFVRPFGQLIHFYPQVREKLQSMEEAGSRATDGETTPAKETSDALAHLRCYISFVEAHLVPLASQFDRIDHSNQKRVRHDDLWYLFKPGELVFMPRTTVANSVRSKDNRTLPDNAIYQQIWRVYYFRPHGGSLERPMLGRDSSQWEAKVGIYFIDYDGSAYKPVAIDVPLEHFDGEKDIRSLSVYPIRCVSDGESYIKEAAELGIRFTECIKQRHASYKAWTLPNGPHGWKYHNETGRAATTEFIDGDVIIDFHEAFNAEPSFNQGYNGLISDWYSDVVTVRDRFPILLWSNRSRSRLLYEWPHIVVSDDDIDFVLGREYSRKLPYGQNGIDMPPEEDLVLLPRRLYGYSLRERRFMLLDVKHVNLVREEIDAFRFLQIDQHSRRIIECLLTDHFATKEARKTREIPSQDPIPGKGNNLVLLLHGPPGVGKTATVEAMAQKYRKPLFAITSGDLGSTPDAVESSLTEIFHLANVWDCILLLDEADVFLEEREKSDLQRNAVVSVFLRVMEYYNGVLFLTTNRPGQLDEAIKSRVHCALLYKTLSLEQTLEIFRMNIERIEMIEKRRAAGSDSNMSYLQADKRGILAFAEKHWRQHEFDELGRWNGRQIRNAFISAAALARGELDDPNRGDNSPGGGVRPVAVLTDRHFQAIAQSVTAFDKYMARARGGLDSERARTRSDRPDEDFGADDLPGGDSSTSISRNRSRRLTPNTSFSHRPSSSNLGSAGAGASGAGPQSPTPPVRHYNANVSPSPYFPQLAPPATVAAPGYAYPVQAYAGGAAGLPIATMWGAPPGAQVPAAQVGGVGVMGLQMQQQQQPQVQQQVQMQGQMQPQIQVQSQIQVPQQVQQPQQQQSEGQQQQVGVQQVQSVQTLQPVQQQQQFSGMGNMGIGMGIGVMHQGAAAGEKQGMGGIPPLRPRTPDVVAGHLAPQPM